MRILRKILPDLKIKSYYTLSSLLLVLGVSLIGFKFNLAPLLAQKPIFEKITLNNQFSPDPLILEGVSGGTQEGRAIAGRAETPTGACVGFVDTEPDIKLTLTDFFEYLKVQVESPTDTTMIITGPGGTWCNDDLKDKNPSVAGQWLAGTYNIWIGSYESGTYQPYKLKISKFQ